MKILNLTSKTSKRMSELERRIAILENKLKGLDELEQDCRKLVRQIREKASRMSSDTKSVLPYLSDQRVNDLWAEVSAELRRRSGGESRNFKNLH